MYKTIWSKEAYGFLAKLDPFLARRIASLVGDFSKDPSKREFKRLKGEKSFRLRAGDYRVIFDINHAEKTIVIIKIGHRKNIHD